LAPIRVIYAGLYIQIKKMIGREVLEEYEKWDPNPSTKALAQNMIKEGPEDRIKALFDGPRIAFGTAGLRGPMDLGYKCMNDLIILQTCQGLCKYLNAKGEANRNVVIGYDHRCTESGAISSKNFARLSAAVFLAHDFEVTVLEGEEDANTFAATPFVPFAMKKYSSCAGIMVTASHNPKADNGFKVYWGNACQIIPPHDDGIATAILETLIPEQDYKYLGDDWNITVKNAGDKLRYGSSVLNQLVDDYIKDITSLRFGSDDITTDNYPKVCYTAMHGVGKPWVQRSLAAFGLPVEKLEIVAAQADPDATFPTVSFPNPEEKGALDIAKEYAFKTDCTLVVANDPDADRLAVCEYQKDESKWVVFSGNEIGVLLGYWAMKRYSQNSGDPKTAAVIASVVSSRMLRAVAQKEGFQYYDTLTGFKHIGNKAVALQAAGISVLFGYEEAIGFAYGDVVFDKDGVSAAAVFVEMAACLAKEGKNLAQQLAYLRSSYGDFVSYNAYKICHDSAITDKLFERLRQDGSGNIGTYMSTFDGVAATSIKDVTLGFDSTTADNVLDMPATPGSHMIMYEFENGVSFTLRTSGTEPKIKFYTELAAASGIPRDQALMILQKFVDATVRDMLQTEKYGL